MRKDVFAESRLRFVPALAALVVLVGLGLALTGLVRLCEQTNDRAVLTVLDSLSYTETEAEAELRALEALTDRVPLSVAAQGQLYQALSEISYMLGDDMLYNHYVAHALFYQRRAGENTASVYLTNRYIGRLYANGCYDSAAEVLQELAEKNDISALSLDMQASYYLSCADVAEMLGRDPSAALANAQAALQLMPEDGTRQLNLAKLHLLTARELLQQGDVNAAEALLSGYSEADAFGFGSDQVYVVCDFRIPYYELSAKLALARQDYAAAYSYVDLYLAACDVYQFRTMKLRLLQYVVSHSDNSTGDDSEKYRLLEKAVCQQNLEEMTSEYGQFLLADIDATTERLLEQEASHRQLVRRMWLGAGCLYLLVVFYCVGMAFLDYANKDGLTKLKNRREYENARDHCEKRGIPYGMLMLDIDDFKKVNDTFGHDRGDEVLRGISDILRRYAGRGISAYRYGGEELCMMFVRVPEKRVREIAEEIRAAIASTVGGETLHVTVSGGVSMSETGENVFRAADQKLYEAKRSGKNRIL